MTTGRTFYPAAVLFLLTAAFMLVRTGRDALYFQEGGLEALPKAYVVIAFLSMPQALAVLAAISRFGARNARLLVLILTMLTVATMAVLAEPGGGPLMTAFFAMVPLVFAISFSMSWLLGTELTEGLDSSLTARAFSRFGGASILGGTAGSLAARLIASSASANDLLGIGTALIGASCILVYAAHKNFAAPALTDSPAPIDDSEPPRFFAGISAIGRSRYARLLLVVSMTAALAGILIEFLFYFSASQRGDVAGGEIGTVFFANVYLMLNGVSLVLQLLVSPWVQRWIGLAGGLMVLPIAVGFSAVSLALTSGVGARAGVRILEGSLKSGLHRSMWEQSYQSVPAFQRPSTKVLIDGMAARIAEGSAAAAVWVWLTRLDRGGQTLTMVDGRWLLWALGAAATVWLVSSLALSRVLRDDSSRMVAPGPEQVTLDGACVGTAAFGHAVDTARRGR